ncbi:N-6 DNA methylase, partial [Streptococcus pneumoniae]
MLKKKKNHLNKKCIVTLPGQLFYSTQIPVCLWFISNNKGQNGKK